MNIKHEELKFELKELITLVKLNEKYASIVADGVFPIDQQAIEFHSQRQIRIDELSRKYGIA
ncbi:hypothetical protein [Pseudomonas sp. DC3000-4b1]|uniref:hypothetical protein n=1 Tax=unclassified Pseudomonas TaxID=196821 RepID=UPI003CF7A22A